MKLSDLPHTIQYKGSEAHLWAKYIEDTKRYHVFYEVLPTPEGFDHAYAVSSFSEVSEEQACDDMITMLVDKTDELTDLRDQIVPKQ